ncbi:MAG: DUF4476 domain-containing protein [Taibaiella sp.]|nr:DUF4476 domain-containing protein [Taibaiella sp.]
MNRLFYTLLLVITALGTAVAQYSQRSVLEIRMNDHEPIVVSVDGRYYNKHGRTITIGNLPKGWHDLRVYEYLEYRKGGGRAKLLYTGRIRIEPGTVTACVVDRQTGRMRTRTMDIEDAYLDYDQPDNDDRYKDDNNRRDRNSNILNNTDLNELKARVEDRITDTEKLELMKSVLEKRRYYSVQVRTMMEWLAFESSKLDFAKWSYDRALDKQDYWKLEDVFTFSSSKDEFNQYISSR